MVGKPQKSTRRYTAHNSTTQNFPINTQTIESLRYAANFLALFANTLEVGSNVVGVPGNTGTIARLGLGSNVVPITHKRRMSAATRRKIAQASKKRWAQQRAAPTKVAA